jgi:phage N-6-adenine-methyltransferase
MISAGLFNSRNQELNTPIDKYREWDKEFHFNTDPCTTSDNPLGTKHFYTKEDNALIQKWIAPVFINPPYGHQLPNWVKRASMEAKSGNVPIVMLLPARTDTQWFHDYIYYGKATEIRFLKGRLVFGELKNSAPFPSMLAIFREG